MNRPARITQAEIERAIRAAKKAGATVVELQIGEDVRCICKPACEVETAARS